MEAKVRNWEERQEEEAQACLEEIRAALEGWRTDFPEREGQGTGAVPATAGAQADGGGSCSDWLGSWP